MEIGQSDFDFSTLLLKRYNYYRLSDLECLTILICNQLLTRDNRLLLTRDILSKHMASTKEEIDSLLNELIKKGIIEIVNNDNQIYSSIDKFKKRIYDDLIKDIRLEKEGNTQPSSSLYSYLEQLNDRPLSSIERDYISNWLKDGISESLIKEACVKSKTKNGYISFKKADSYVLASLRSLSRKEIGVSTIDEKRERDNASLLFGKDWDD